MQLGLHCTALHCTTLQVGLHSMQQLEAVIKRIAVEETDRWEFQEEVRALGAAEVQAEFAGYFNDIVSRGSMRSVAVCGRLQRLRRATVGTARPRGSSSSCWSWRGRR